LRPKSQTNRLYWQPGTPHALDCFKQEVEEADQQLPRQIQSLLSKTQETQERLRALFSSEHDQEPFTAADQQTNQIVEQRFGNRKHLCHLQWFFALLRRKRLIGRLRAIEAALDLVNGLLETEETISQELQSALLPPPPSEHARTKEEERLIGIDQPVTQLITDATHSRLLLTRFEQRLPEIRRHLNHYQGWFEVFFVPKRRYKPALIAYLEAQKQAQRHHTPIADEIIQVLHPEVVNALQHGTMPKEMPKTLHDEIYDIIQEGPYIRYRWREDGHIYTISLGLLDDYPPYPFVPSGF
jgi:hypothetical protein